MWSILVIIKCYPAGTHRFAKSLIKRYKGIKANVPDIEKHVRRDSGNLLLNFVSRAPLPTTGIIDERSLPAALLK